MQKGARLADALPAAWTDPVVKDRYLTTPLATVPAHRRRRGDASPAREPQAKKAKLAQVKEGGGSSQRSVAKKGDTKDANIVNCGGRGKCQAKMPNGKLICFAFNGKGCNARKCRFEHVCGRCYGDHSMKECGAGGPYQ